MMGNPVQIFVTATKEVLRGNRSYQIWLAGITLILFAAYVLLPIWLTPGNTLTFQLSILQPSNYLLFLILSLVTALLVVMQMYLVRQSRERKQMAAAIGSSGVGVYSALVGGLLATAACTSCVAVLFGFLGAGSLFFILANRWYFIAGAIALVLVALYFTARRINGLCEDCEVPRDDQGK